MSDSLGDPWSDNPNAPRISTELHTEDKQLFVGRVIGAMAYGVVVILFFQCMEASVESANNVGKRVKWGLAIHTVALFLFLTIHTVMDLHLLSTGYIDNRSSPDGPVGNNLSINYSTAFTVIYNATFLPLNQWLVDGFLLYRCYVIYPMNHRIMVLPCLIYATSVVTGLMSTFGISVYAIFMSNSTTAYYSICLSLNVLLTLMIIARVVLHSRNTRRDTVASERAMELYSTIVTMLVESCALYAAALLLFIVPYAIGSRATFITKRITSHCQVIGPYLITLRVAKRRALTDEMVTSGLSSIQFASQVTTSGDRSLPDGDRICSTQTDSEAPDEVGAMGENGIEEVPSRQGPKVP